MPLLTDDEFGVTPNRLLSDDEFGVGPEVPANKPPATASTSPRLLSDDEFGVAREYPIGEPWTLANSSTNLPPALPPAQQAIADREAEQLIEEERHPFTTPIARPVRALANLGVRTGFNRGAREIFGVPGNLITDAAQAGPTLEDVAAEPGLDKGTKVLAGTMLGVSNLADFFTSPLGVATLGIGAMPVAAQRAVAVAFATQMARQTPEIARAIGDEMGKPEEQRDYAKIAQLATEGMGNTYFAAKGFQHGAAEPIMRKLGILPKEAEPAPEPAAAATVEKTAEVTPDLLADLQATIQGNQIKKTAASAEAPAAELTEPKVSTGEERLRPVSESDMVETGAAAETITGQNERTGSEAPAAATSAAEPMPAEVATPQKPRPSSFESSTEKILQRDLRAEVDPVLGYLDSLKLETSGRVHAFGLLPEAWNTLVDLVKLGVRAGRSTRDAIAWAIERFKAKNPDATLDEAGATEYLTTHEEAAPIRAELLKQRKEGRAAGFVESGAEAEAARKLPEQPPMPPATETPQVEATVQEPPPATDYQSLKVVAQEKSEAYSKTLRDVNATREAGQNPTGEMIAARRVAKQQHQAAQKALANSMEHAEALILEHEQAVKDLRTSRERGLPDDIARKQLRADSLAGQLESLSPKNLNTTYTRMRNEGRISADTPIEDIISEPRRRSEREPGPAGPVERPPEDRARTGKKYYGLETLPAGNLRDVVRNLDLQRQRLAAWWRGKPVRSAMTYLWDGAMNKSRGVARQVSNLVLHELNRSFGEAPGKVGARRELREAALSFVTEADGDRARLGEFRDKITASDFADTKTGRQALAALQYAEENWDTFNKPRQGATVSVPELQQELTAFERGSELNAGLDVPEWQSPYIMHATVPEESGVLVKQAQGGGISQKFTRRRTNPTLADDIAAGVPLRSLSAIDLLEARTRYGQENVNAISWMHGLRELKDPTTEQPLVTDVEMRARKNGRLESQAPPGYSVVNVGRVEFAMLNGYDGVFDDLSSPSWWRRGATRRVTQKAIATAKHLITFFDTMHFGVEAIRKFLLTGSFSYKKGITLLDNTVADIQTMAKRGEIPEDWVDDLIENKRKLGALVRNGANVHDMSSNLYRNWIEHIPIAGPFNRWLFGQYIRGAMAEAALMKFDSTRRQFPKIPEDAAARRVARDINDIFGNIQNQGLFRSKNGQDLARLFLFAPYWNETMARTELGAVKQLAKAPFESIAQRRPVLGVKAQAVAAGVVGLFAANQVINLITRGTPTWNNPEEGFGAKISAWIPDAIGDGPGFFLNPFALTMKLTHVFWNKIERNLEEAQPKGLGQTVGAVLRGTAEGVQSRLTPAFRAALTPMTRRDQFGRPLRNEEILPTMADTLVPLPIVAPTLYQAGKQLVTGEHSEAYRGQFQRQIASSGGILLDQAPTPGQRISKLARHWRVENNLKLDQTEFPHGDYEGLDRAVERGNKTDEARELEQLLGKRTPPEIARHYQTWARAPFSGAQKYEGAFYEHLNAEQRTAYDKARDARQKLARRVLELLATLPQPDEEAP